MAKTSMRHRLRTSFFTRRAPKQKVRELIRGLHEEAQVDLTYIILILGSCAIATCGLLANSVAVIIGAMIMAPLMLPIRSTAFGVLEGDLPLVKDGLIALGLGMAIAIWLSCGLGIISGIPDYGSEVWARSQPNLLDLGVAIVAGGISGLAKVQPKLSGALVGTAIAVALMPPLCVVGLGLALAQDVPASGFALSQGAGLLFLTNLLGITLSCMLAFLMAGYTPLAQAQRGLVLTALFTALLIAPLSVSFYDLVRQTQLESIIRRELEENTATFQEAELEAIATNWIKTPPEIRLDVSTAQGLTPNQVRLLEEFITYRMDQPFTVVVEMTQLEEVRRQERLAGGGR
ncbi:MAG: DUF389 domain-containing protein [Leptolyngbyaceae bacterium]|nr:DUF389 domain-containing protein [Leptolyngbyaceae bacterium]